MPTLPEQHHAFYRGVWAGREFIEIDPWRHRSALCIPAVRPVFTHYVTFRIHAIRTDRGLEFQAQFHWHIEGKGIRHVYIRPHTPQLNGKVDRSHRFDREEFYQLLTYTDDVDLNKKLAEWEWFYNFGRPHGAFDGRAPYEALRTMLK